MVTLYTIYTGICEDDKFENIEWEYSGTLRDPKGAYTMCETWAKVFHHPYRIMRTDYTTADDGETLTKINDSVYHISLPPVEKGTNND